MYKNYDDYELMYLISESSEEASDILYKKYKDTVTIIAKKYINYGKKLGLELNDIVQEGMLGLSEAIESYKEHKDTKFSSFAVICIERQIITALLRSSRKKNMVLNESFSLDQEINGEGKTVLDFLFDDYSDPSIRIEDEEHKKQLQEAIDNELTPLEKEVFDLKLAGFEYKEIGTLLNKSYKSIDSALQRIRLKIKKVLTK